jgi:transcriptional regulator with XRE-family HTH domain
MPIHRTYSFARRWMPAAEATAFASRLRVVRRACGMSQQALSETLGVSTTTVSYWENGRTQPMPEKIPEVAALLGVTEAFLRTGSNENSHAVDTTTEREASGSIAFDIEQLRRKIASAIGISPGQVRVSVEFSSAS